MGKKYLMILTNKNFLILLFLFVSSLSLRLINPASADVFASSDIVDVPYSVSISFPRTLSSFNPYADSQYVNPLTLILKGHGILMYLIGFLSFIFYSILGIHITEFLWNLPSIIITSLTGPFFYLFVLEITKKRDLSVINGILISVVPALFFPSAYISVSFLALVPLTSIVSFLFFIYFFKNPSKKNAILASIFFTIDLFNNVLLPLNALVILYIGVCYNRKQKIRSKKNSKMRDFLKQIYLSLNKTVRQLIRPQILILPLLFVIFLIITNIFSLKMYGRLIGVLAGVLNNNSTASGIYLINYLKSTNIIFTKPIAFLILIFTAISFYKVLSPNKKYIPLFCGAIYSIPFIFLFSRRPEFTACYVVWGSIFLLINMFIFLDDLTDNIKRKINKRRIAIPIYLLFVCVLFVFLTGTISIIIQTTFISFIKPGFYGTLNGKSAPFYNRDTGAKAAGYWLRENTELDDIIFADSSSLGVGNIEPPVTDYYFHRNTISSLDATNEEVIDTFDKYHKYIDYVIVSPRNKDFLRIVDKNSSFYLTLVFKKDDLILLLLYSREKPEKIKEANVETLNKLYDIKYTSFSKIVELHEYHSNALLVPDTRELTSFGQRILHGG